MSKEFDQLIKDGELAKAGRFFAREGYENGDFGFTRKTLIEYLADRFEEAEVVLKENESHIKYIKQLENKIKRLEAK